MMFFRTLTLTLLLLIGSTTCFSRAAQAKQHEQETTVIVNTAQGPLRILKGEVYPDIYTAHAIPFAQPPLNDLRFERAQFPPSPWMGVRNATDASKRVGCMGGCGNPRSSLTCPWAQSEDCLYLSLTTPSVDPTANLPVIVFAHGGDFTEPGGASLLYDGSKMSQRGNVVMVSINYRVGIFGGLYTGRVRGNMHLSDAIAALKWVQQNIRAFGGDPDSVTFSGQSAGGAMASFVTASPAAWPHFKRAIPVSNPLGILAATPELAMKLGNIALKRLNCPADGGEDQIACLRNKTAEELRDHGSSANLPLEPNSAFVSMMRWTCVVDGNLLPQQAFEAYLSNNFGGKQVMFTNNANESIQFIFGALGSRNLTKEEAEIAITFFLNFNTTLAAEAIKQYGPVPDSPIYNGAPVPNFYKLFLAPAVTDLLFYCPARRAVKQMAQANPSTSFYMYLFDFYSERLFKWWYAFENSGRGPMAECALGPDAPGPKWYRRCVCHASGLPLIFSPRDAFIAAAKKFPHKNLPIPPPWSAAEEQLIEQMQDTWINFAWTGDPNRRPPALARPLLSDVLATKSEMPPFPRIDSSFKIMNFSIPAGVLHDYRKEFCDFWDKAGYKRW